MEKDLARGMKQRLGWWYDIRLCRQVGCMDKTLCGDFRIYSFVKTRRGPKATAGQTGAEMAELIKKE